MSPVPEPSSAPDPAPDPTPDGPPGPERNGAPTPAPRPVPIGRRIPWTTRSAAVLLGFPAALSATFGLMILVLSLTGGGASLGSSPGPDPDPVAGLLLGLAILGVAGAIMVLSVGIWRGRLMPSLIAASLGVVLLVAGVREMGSSGANSGVRDLLLPGALLALLVSRSHRAYIATREAGWRGADERIASAGTGRERGRPE